MRTKRIKSGIDNAKKITEKRIKGNFKIKNFIPKTKR